MEWVWIKDNGFILNMLNLKSLKCNPSALGNSRLKSGMRYKI
jgi:hypothetical protein